MYQVSRMELTGVEQARLSTLYEVRSIQRSFFKMVFALHSFRKYVPDVVIKKSLANSQVAELHMTSEYLTLFFLDIEDFTVLSERMRPDELVIIIGEGLEGTSDIVTRRGGCVDKYIGDAVVALFNAPLDVADHALNAVQCAAELDRFAQEFKQAANTQGLLWGETRIGVHTGEVIVGNMGGQKRFDYTAVGDAMNIASKGNAPSSSEECPMAATEGWGPGRASAMRDREGWRERGVGANCAGQLVAVAHALPAKVKRCPMPPATRQRAPPGRRLHSLAFISTN